MSKIISLLLILFAGYWLLRGRFGREAKRPVARPAETMVQCRHCGIYLPKGEAVAEAEFFFCGEMHRRLDRSSQ